jgi:hypothetical protein
MSALRLKLIPLEVPQMSITPSTANAMITAYAKKPKHPNKKELTAKPIPAKTFSLVIKHTKQSVAKSTSTTPKVSLVNTRFLFSLSSFFLPKPFNSPPQSSHIFLLYQKLRLFTRKFLNI